MNLKFARFPHLPNHAIHQMQTLLHLNSIVSRDHLEDIKMDYNLHLYKKGSEQVFAVEFVEMGYALRHQGRVWTLQDYRCDIPKFELFDSICPTYFLKTPTMKTHCVQAKIEISGLQVELCVSEDDGRDNWYDHSGPYQQIMKYILGEEEARKNFIFDSSEGNILKEELEVTEQDLLFFNQVHMPFLEGFKEVTLPLLQAFESEVTEAFTTNE